MIRYLIFLLALASAAFSQTRDTASLLGNVSDQQGAAIVAATVVLTNAATGQVRTIMTDADGRYKFSLLPVGSYQMSVEQPAFRRYERTGIVLQANENVKLDVTLEIGDVKSTVTVNAAGSQVETEVATLRETVDQKRIVDLPLNGRDAAQLALLVPGVVSGGYNTGVSGQDSFSFNGSRNNNVRFTLDGGQNMDNHYNMNVPFPFPDAVQEFSVQTSNMGPDQGNSSAGAVNIVTKSGTNELHGDVFWFVRNSNFNATNFFSHQPDSLKRNQVGFTLGGPIIKNKLFAFGGYQQLWIRSAPGNLRFQTLTAAERQGDFSASTQTIRNPVTNAPYPGNRIPADQLSPAALKLLEVSPLPGPDGFTNYSISTPENGKQFIGRLDYVINERQSLLFRAFDNEQEDPFHSPAGNINASRRASEAPSKSGTLAHNFTVSPNMVVHTQFSGTHIIEKGKTDLPLSYADFGIAVYAPSNDITVTLANSGVSFAAPHQRLFKRASEELIHDWTWTHGAHTFTWGTQISWGQYNEATLYHVSGAFSFDGHASGYDRSDFMLGAFSSFDQNNGEYENRRQFLKGFYAGDNWRISRRLTLNLGVRYEPYTFFSDTMDRNQTFDLGNFASGVKSKIFLNAPPGLLYRGDAVPENYPCGPAIPKAVACRDNNNIAPRIGLAWDPFGDGKTSIRAGYGIFYDVPMTRAQNNSNDVAPFSYGVQFYSGQLDNPYAGRENLNLFPITTFDANSPYPSPLQTYVLPSKWVTAETQNWNFTIERQLFSDTRLRVAYVGTKGSHLMGYYDQNAPIYNSALTLSENRATIDERRPIPGFEQIFRDINGLNSVSNALQVSINKRFSHGFSVLSSYTWSKSIDLESVNDGIGGYAASYPFNFSLWRGPSNQNIPHRFVTSFVWQLPGPKASGLAKYMLGDWRLSGILTLQSGVPFDVLAVGDPLAGIPGDRANLSGVGNPVLDPSRSKNAKIQQYFDVSRFTNAGPGMIGTLGRNVMEGPGLSNLDASLVKAVRLPFLGEGGLTELRLESFNALNRTNFNNPVTGLTNPRFGQLTSAADPRILQMAVKIIF
jgi:outer membrane receptor protein involved in Fe transport